jgi:hypothetical protein
MEIKDSETGRRIHVLELGLTPAEARELRDNLELLLASNDARRHEHVSSTDYQEELTVWIRPDE